MKLSESWLREWVNPSIDSAELVEQITMAGLEVDGVESVAGNFSGVVVGEIISIEQHPDADKLRVCQVAGNGSDTVQVVCGAPNARQGIKIPFATVGAALPSGDDGKPFKIKKAKLRGVESFGMLCAQTELQAGDDDDGLWELPKDAPVGTDLREYLQFNDQIIEVDLTPNRADCLSVKGIAREVGVLNRQDVTPPTAVAVAPTIDDAFAVSIQAGEQAPRYAGRVIRNVDVSAPSPLWLQEKLRRSGIRSIDAVVDVTNYVLLELGQPMHAFDLNTLEQGIQVRMAEQDEKLTLLDGQEVSLNSDTLVIADQSKAVAMAGIMGGQDTAVTTATQDIFLESAFFTPLAISGRARRYGLHTDSSHRFERGVDYLLQEQAIERATELLLSIVGGDPGPVTVVESDAHMPQAVQVELRRARIQSGLGFAMDDSDVVEILTRLGLTLDSTTDKGWIFAVPSYRFDISLEVDLLEELARVYGYNNLPVTSQTTHLKLSGETESTLKVSTIRQQLVGRDYQEAVVYSFVDPKLQALFQPEIEPVALKNPISADLAVMRTSLMPGLVNALQHNLNRQQNRVRLFETGQRFVPQGEGLDKLKQEPVLAGLIYGDKLPESWAAGSEKVDFFDIKGDLESILSLTGAVSEFSFVAGQHSALHPGQTAELQRNGNAIGVVGALHPQIQQQLGIAQPVYLFEVVLSAITQAAVPSFEELSKFPGVRRDLAVIADQTLPVKTLTDAVRKVAGEHLKNLKVFDVYVGKGIDPHRKSVALGLTFQHPSRTLNEDEINASIDAVVQHLEANYGATLR